jgi:hypothetical protein
MATPLGDAKYWHQHAEQCRARANRFKDPIIRVRMFMIANGYDRIAQDTEKIEARRGFGGPAPRDDVTARLSPKSSARS